MATTHSHSIPLRSAEAMEREPHRHDSHTHTHTDTLAAPTHNLGPTYDSTVVMEIGGDTGGLVVYTDGDQLGVEVDIFVRGCDEPLTHTAIRERNLPDRVLYAGVYPGLPAGDYTIAPLGSRPATDVTIVGGAVVEVHGESTLRNLPSAVGP